MVMHNIVRIRIQDAIKLQNFRQKSKNESKGKPLHVNVLSKANLGRILFPSRKGNGASVAIDRMIKEYKKYEFEQIVTICKETGVDANFLFGFESKHDKEFKLID